MRKTLISLILVLPMVFMLVIFSVAGAPDLSSDVSANGINIIAEGRDEDGTLVIDMADKTSHTVTAEVTPVKAKDKSYTLTSSDESVAEVTKDGLLVPKRQGTVEITATSHDKGFTDTLPVVIVATKPYDFDFTLAAADAQAQNVLEKTAEGYAAEVPAGEYRYGISIAPAGFTAYNLEEEPGTYAEIEKGAKTLMLPFSGEAVFGITVPDGVRGDIRKTLRLNVTKPKDTFLINGEAVNSGQGTMFWDTKIAYGTQEVQLYLECENNFVSFTSDHARLNSDEMRSLKNGRYILPLELDAVASGSGVEKIEGVLNADGKTCNITFTFTEFEFSLYSDMPVAEKDGAKHATLFTDRATSFYAVTSGGAKGVEYEWTFEGPAEYFKRGTLSVPGDMVTITPKKDGEEFVLHVKATYGTEVKEAEVNILAVKEIGVIQIKNNTKADLAECYTVAGLVYADGMTKTSENTYALQVYSHSTAGGTDRAGGEVEYTVKALTGDTPAATVENIKNIPTVIPTGTGKVEITAAWKYNETFGQNVSATITLNIVKDAVAVKNAPELTKATEEGRAVVLTNNIKLGTDASGEILPDTELKALLQSHRMKSTYNTEWYKYAAGYSENDAYVSYVMEFTNSVYGNGKSIDADNFTHHQDANGTPLLKPYFQGPLHFVTFRDMAYVAGQDSCAFLIRTNNVKLYGVNLLGCSDESLNNPETGEYNLARLNLTGTTLEVNADAQIVNCRIRNGRNVVRIYGGNRDGKNYFVDSLAGSPAGIAGERIHVSIEGCILSHGREFIVKIGANRALRASKINGQEPALTDQSGKAYPETGTSNRYGNLISDEYFYSHYVMTDVTLKDSVVETSGLFTVGMESNFSGQYLYEGSDPSDSYYSATKEWQHSGGTSFAAVLRLEGDVRLYDWKDFSLVDASTLIEATANVGIPGSGSGLSEGLKLNLKAMLELVINKTPAYKGVIQSIDGKDYVHGGIALYGGGRNYSAVDLSKLGKKSSATDTALNDFMYIGVNIGVLKGGQGVLDTQGTILPKAAGSHDFNFYMYGSNSANNYLAQLNDEQKGLKYSGVSKLSAF